MPYRKRCLCGHPEDQHRHYTRADDTRCGTCGQFCPHYVPIGSPVPPSHTLVAAYSDAHVYRNLAALAQFAHPRPHAIPVPAQRRPGGTVAGQYAHHLKTTGRRR